MLQTMAAMVLLMAAPQAPLLPDAVGEWSAANDEEIFVGDELFLYINGGADIYHEYGFDRVTVRDYSRGNDGLVVEVYAMAGDAFGIFSVLRSDQAEPVDLCDGGSLGGYYARFWCGSFLVAVTAGHDSSDAKGSVREVAKELASDWSGGGSPPALLEMLPEKYRLPGSEVFLVGPLGMRKAAPEVARFFRGEGVLARYRLPEGREGTLLLVLYPDDQAATNAMEAFREGATPELEAERRGRMIAVVIADIGLETAQNLLNLIERSP